MKRKRDWLDTLIECTHYYVCKKERRGRKYIPRSGYTLEQCNERKAMFLDSFKDTGNVRLGDWAAYIHVERLKEKESSA